MVHHLHVAKMLGHFSYNRSPLSKHLFSTIKSQHGLETKQRFVETLPEYKRNSNSSITFACYEQQATVQNKGYEERSKNIYCAILRLRHCVSLKVKLSNPTTLALFANKFANDCLGNIKPLTTVIGSFIFST